MFAFQKKARKNVKSSREIDKNLLMVHKWLNRKAISGFYSIKKRMLERRKRPFGMSTCSCDLCQFDWHRNWSHASQRQISILMSHFLRIHPIIFLHPIFFFIAIFVPSYSRTVVDATSCHRWLHTKIRTAKFRNKKNRW